MDEGPLAAPPDSDTRSTSRSLAMSMDRARSVLLGKSDSSNHRVTDFFRMMTAEQEAEYDARQAVKAAADKRRREEPMLQELANKKKPGRPITRPMVKLPEQCEAEMKELRISNESNSLMQPQIRQLLQPAATEMADRLLFMAMS
jgi:hypothetical protein